MKKIYLLLLCLVSMGATAQSYQFTVYNTGNSQIPANNINDIKKSPLGPLWIATNNGLSALLGNTFTNYNTTNSGIATNMLRKIAIGIDNRIYATTFGQGIIMRDGTIWNNFTTANSGLPSNDVAGIATDALGNLWAATSLGLTKFNGTTWTTYNMTNSNLNLSNNVTSVFTDTSNNVWISAGNALQKFNGTSFTIITDGVEKILKIKGNSIYVDAFDGFAKIVTPNYSNYYFTDTSCLAGCEVQALDIDQDNKVWLGLGLESNCSNGGIQRFNDCVTYTTENSGLSNNNISSIHIESLTEIWAGTFEGGLVKMTRIGAPIGCNNPSSPFGEATSSTTATITWQPADPAPNNYVYIYNTEYALEGIDGTTSSTSATLENLLPTTSYYW